MESRIFITCPRGLEEVTSQELSSLLNKNNTIDRGGVYLDGDILDIRSKVHRAFIQGRSVDMNDRHKMLDYKYRIKYQQKGILK